MDNLSDFGKVARYKLIYNKQLHFYTLAKIRIYNFKNTTYNSIKYVKYLGINLTKRCTLKITKYC